MVWDIAMSNTTKQFSSTTEYKLDNYEKWKQVDNRQTIISNTTMQYLHDNKAKQLNMMRPISTNSTIILNNYDRMKRLKTYEMAFSNGSTKFGYTKSGRIVRLKSYESINSDSTIKRIFRSSEVKLGDIKHHVFIMRLYNVKKNEYRAFCAGNIITEQRVLSSAQCFSTNRKRLRHNLKTIRMVAGLLVTVAPYPPHDDIQQWRIPVHVFTQKFYRFPAYSLAVVHVTEPWEFNPFINKIPIAKRNEDFDGVCTGVVVRVTTSWAYKKAMYTEPHRIVPRDDCENILVRSCKLYICTMEVELPYIYETPGGGIICFDTNTPEEDEEEGLLVAVTVLVNKRLPSLHHRVGPFSKWVEDGSTHLVISGNLLLLCLCTVLILNKIYCCQ